MKTRRLFDLIGVVINYIPRSLYPTKEFLVYAIGTLIFLLISQSVLAQWYDADWSNRKEITINKDEVSGTHTNFPILVNLTDTDLAAIAKSDGTDIIFVDDDGATRLMHELEEYNNGTGEVTAWVKVDISDVADKTIYMYFGNPSAPDVSGTYEDVWTDYERVFHMEGTSDASNTANATDMSSGAAPDDVTGIIGGAKHFNAGGDNDEYYDTNLDLDTDLTGSYTMSAWVYADDDAVQVPLNTNDPMIIGNTYKGALTWEHNGVEGGAYLYAGPSGWKTLGPSPAPVAGRWYYMAISYDDGGKSLDYYLYDSNDGSLQTLNSSWTGSSAQAQVNHLGDKNVTIAVHSQTGDGIHDYFFDGILDEVRVGGVARSQGWLTTEFNNISSSSVGPSEFISSVGPLTSNCPTAGTATISQSSVTYDGSSTVSLSGYLSGHYGIKWQKSTDNVIFSDIVGATTDSHSENNITQTLYFRAEVDYDSCQSLSNVVSVSPQASFDGTYCQRKKITIDQSMVSGSSDLSNFPVLVRLEEYDLRNTGNGGLVDNVNGWDIVFMDDDGTTQLNHEIEYYDPTTGEYIAWVQIPTLKHNEDTDLYLYFGQTGATDPSTTATWEASYVGVWHLNSSADDASTYAQVTSTDDSNDAVGKIASARYFDGSQGILIDDDASLDLTTAYTLSAWFKTNITTHNWERIVAKSHTSDAAPYTMYGMIVEFGSNALRGEAAKSGGQNASNGTTALTPAGGWYYGTVTYDGSNIRVFLNGAAEGTPTAVAAPIDANNQVLSIGRSGFAKDYFNGSIDEVRVSNVARSTDWIATEYNNQLDPTNYITVSSNEFESTPGSVSAADPVLDYNLSTTLTLADNGAGTIQWESSTNNFDFSSVSGGSGATTTEYTTANLTESTYFRSRLTVGSCNYYSNSARVSVRDEFLPGYTYRQQLTISEDVVSGTDDLTNFPFLVEMTVDELKTKANGGKVEHASGWDIYFTEADGMTQLFYERAEYNASTGYLRAWLNIPTLYANADTEIYLYYGNCSVSSDPSSSDAWNNNYRAVYHIDGTSDMDDASGNGFNLTNSGTSNVTGVVGDALDFDGSGDHLKMPTNMNILNSVTEATLSMWVSPDNLSNSAVLIGIAQGGGTTSSSRASIEINPNSANEIGLGGRTQDGGVYREKTTLIKPFPVASQWYHISAFFDYANQDVSLYINGEEVSMTPNGTLSWPTTITDASNSSNGSIGSEDNHGGQYFNGYIDEVRVLDTGLSASWIKTEYNNQLNPGGFTSLGEEEGEFQWTGVANGDWSNTGNWSNCETPADGTDVRIPDVMTNDPELDVDVVLGDLILDTDAQLSLQGRTLELQGSLRNNGTIVSSTSTVVFTGSETQFFSGDAITLNNVTMNKTAGGTLELSQDITINGTLTLTSGYINMAEQTLTIPAGNITGGSSDSFIVTPGTTCLNQTNVGASNVIFPIGASISSYNPATLNNAGTADDFCVRIMSNVFQEGGDSGTQVTAEVVDKTWYIDESVVGGSNVTLTLQWNSGDQMTLDTATAFISHYDAGNNWWEQLNSGNVANQGAGAFALTAVGVNDFSPFGVGSGSSPLPIELTTFEARLAENDVILTWQTASEINNESFTIERSKDLNTFEAIGGLDGQGNSNELVNYQFTDRNPLRGKSYYRLKQTDFDGSFSYSDVRVVENYTFKNPVVTSYPNPSDGTNFTLLLEDFEPESEAQIILYDMGGNVITRIGVWTDLTGRFEGTRINTQRLRPGIYFLKTIMGPESVTQKLVVR